MLAQRTVCGVLISAHWTGSLVPCHRAPTKSSLVISQVPLKRVRLSADTWKGHCDCCQTVNKQNNSPRQKHYKSQKTVALIVFKTQNSAKRYTYTATWIKAGSLRVFQTSRSQRCDSSSCTRTKTSERNHKPIYEGGSSWNECGEVSGTSLQVVEEERRIRLLIP